MDTLFLIVGAVVLLYITGLLTPIRKMASGANRAIDEFNHITENKLTQMHYRNRDEHTLELGEIKQSMLDTSKPRATEAELEAILRGTYKPA